MHRGSGSWLVVLTVALSLLMYSTPAMALLFSGWGSTPTVTDPNNDAVPNPGGAKDITAVWYAYNGGYDYFRMDLDGPITADDFASIYRIRIGEGQAARTLVAEYLGEVLTAASFRDGSSLTPIVSEISTDGKTLEWKIPLGLIDSRTFSFYGETIRLGVHNDRTDSATVPLPGAAWLLGSGVVALVGLKRRKNGSRQ